MPQRYVDFPEMNKSEKIQRSEALTIQKCNESKDPQGKTIVIRDIARSEIFRSAGDITRMITGSKGRGLPRIVSAFGVSRFRREFLPAGTLHIHPHKSRFANTKGSTVSGETSLVARGHSDAALTLPGAIMRGRT